MHPADRLLLWMAWRRKVYIDAALPFRLRLGPKIFNAIADGLQWILVLQGVKVTYYLVDFLPFEAPGTNECEKARAVTERVYDKLGLPITAHKTQSPTCAFNFWGIEMDSGARMLHVRWAKEKLHWVQEEIRQWMGWSSCCFP